MYSKEIFDQDCRLCKRLDDFLCEIKQKHPDYHARPVAPFGDKNPKLLIVGLAPGMHGANATGRPFTRHSAPHHVNNILNCVHQLRTLEIGIERGLFLQ